MGNEHSSACMSSGVMSATWRVLRSVALVLSISSVACSNAPSSSGQPDGAASPVDDLSETLPPNVVGTFTLYNGTTQTPIEGAMVASNNLGKPTNALGEARIDLPAGLPFHVTATAAGFLPMIFVGITGPADFSMGRGLLSEMQLNQLAGALGIAYDSASAIIAVNIAGADRKSLPQSIKVAADASVGSNTALVPDRSSPVGYKKSNTTIPGETSQVFLINVLPGAVPLLVTPPIGMSCTVYPSSKPQGSELVIGYARSITTVTLTCQ